MTNLWFLFLIFSGIWAQMIWCLSIFNAINMVIRAVAAIAHSLTCWFRSSLTFGWVISFSEFIGWIVWKMPDFITGTFAAMSMPYKHTICYTEASQPIRLQLLSIWRNYTRSKFRRDSFFLALPMFVGVLMNSWWLPDNGRLLEIDKQRWTNDVIRPKIVEIWK